MVPTSELVAFCHQLADASGAVLRRHFRRKLAVESKRDEAKRFGATHVAASLQEAYGIIQQETRGRMCTKVIACVGVGDGADLAATMQLVAKRGRLVVTNIHPVGEATIAIPAVFLTVFEKQLIGSLFGSANPRRDIPKLLEVMGAHRHAIVMGSRFIPTRNAIEGGMPWWKFVANRVLTSAIWHPV